MRFIHLSDLHFGKSLYGVSLIDHGDQGVWVEHFLQQAEALSPDAVVIAGDIYDRSAPSGDAVTLFGGMLTRLAGLGIPVLMVAGNHDSGQRLAFAGEILAKQKVHIAGVLTKKLLSVTLPEKDGSGEVTFWLLPYLFPAQVAQLLEDDSIRDYDTAARRLLALQEMDFSRRNVLVAHQNVTVDGREGLRGGSESMIGGVGQIDYTAFDGFDYVALGHIHASYPVGRPEVRYAGSPLCYHFNETKQSLKGPLLVELGKKGSQVQITRLPIQPLCAMKELRGTYEEVLAAGERETKDTYIRIVLTDRRVTAEAAQILRSRLESRGCLVMELVSDYQEYHALRSGGEAGGREQKLVEEYFAELYREKKDGAEPDRKDLELFQFAAGQVREAEAKGQKGEVSQSHVEELLDFLLQQETASAETSESGSGTRESGIKCPKENTP